MTWLRNSSWRCALAQVFAVLLIVQAVVSAAVATERLSLRLMGLDWLIICHGAGGVSVVPAPNEPGEADRSSCPCCMAGCVSGAVQMKAPVPAGALFCFAPRRDVGLAHVFDPGECDLPSYLSCRTHDPRSPPRVI